MIPVNLQRDENYPGSEVFACEFPKVILPDYKRSVYVFDDPILREDPEFYKSFPLYVQIEKNPAIYNAQVNHVQWIYDSAILINSRADRFLSDLARSEMVDIVNDKRNAVLSNRHSLFGIDFHKRLYGLSSISIYDVMYAGHVIYSLDLSYAYDDEHGLSLLFVGRSLISSDGGFHNRGEELIPHAIYVSRLRDGHDQIPGY